MSIIEMMSAMIAKTGCMTAGQSRVRSDAPNHLACLIGNLYEAYISRFCLAWMAFSQLTLQARVIAEVGRILEVAARQGNACRDAADQLAYLHGELDAGHTPAYDVASAVTVLRTGDASACFQRLSVLTGLMGFQLPCSFKTVGTLLVASAA